MTLADRDILRRMGQGERLAVIADLDGRSVADLEAWFAARCRERVPPADGTQRAAHLGSSVTIVRDAQGLPHVTAANEADAFFGFGFAVAQDRLFQLDYLRRKARGRLAEILGPEAVESDRLCRTIDLDAVAAVEWEHLPADIRALVTRYSDGVNAAMDACGDRPPIEFDLLDYRPEPWLPLDCLAIVAEFRWYLTGRFPVIAIPELVRRAVGDGALYEAFLLGEEDDECIVPAGSYPRRAGADSSAPRSVAAGTVEPGAGSNNWVVSAARLDEHGPLVASDPHVPFAAVSIWHQVHVRGGRYNFAGISLAGMPGVMIGRNERVAWGVTNNICSQRDLYLEQRHPERPDHFRYGDAWEAARERSATIHVRGADPIALRIVSTRNGPLVDDLLPAAAQGTGPVSIRWLGHEPCGWVAAVIGMNGSRTVDECRSAMRSWLVPTFNMVYADVHGHIGYQCSGQIPLRRRIERGYRQGWNPDDAWQGSIPFDEMPRLADPPSGAIATANNRVAEADFPHPLSGTWVSGYRARRIRLAIESAPRLVRDDHRQLQLDVNSNRAARCVPALLAALGPGLPPLARAACDRLAAWDFQMSAEACGAAIFHVFFTHWCRAVTSQRLPAEQVELVSANAGGLAVELLEHDPWTWFDPPARMPAIRAAFTAALAELVQRLGPEPHEWRWGRLHTLVQPHVLSRRGDLGRWFDRHGHPVGGDGHTINSSSPDANHAAWLGAGYRMLAELGDSRCGLWSVELGSVSGHPGSIHYDDQASLWHSGQLVYLSLLDAPFGPTLRLDPKEDPSC